MGRRRVREKERRLEASRVATSRELEDEGEG